MYFLLEAVVFLATFITEEAPEEVRRERFLLNFLRDLDFLERRIAVGVGFLLA